MLDLIIGRVKLDWMVGSKKIIRLDVSALARPSTWSVRVGSGKPDFSSIIFKSSQVESGFSVLSQ